MSYVLVVEDDPEAAGAARELLTDFGYPVVVAPTPSEAVREMLWRRPRVVLADRCLTPPGDRALGSVCDCLDVPLLDLVRSLCLLSRAEHRSEDAPRSTLLAAP